MRSEACDARNGRIVGGVLWGGSGGRRKGPEVEGLGRPSFDRSRPPLGLGRKPVPAAPCDAKVPYDTARLVRDLDIRCRWRQFSIKPELRRADSGAIFRAIHRDLGPSCPTTSPAELLPPSTHVKAVVQRLHMEIVTFAGGSTGSEADLIREMRAAKQKAIEVRVEQLREQAQPMDEGQDDQETARRRRQPAVESSRVHTQRARNAQP